MNDILVSIWCTTYNHELYIKDALEGFLAQKTNFKYEIIVHDDASTDRTAEIVKEYEQKYFDIIHGIYQIENQTSKNHPSIKWIWSLMSTYCKGKYVAVCEGDDYWIDIQKLQLQVDYLETHPECIMATHDMIVLDCRSYEVKSKSQYTKDCIIPVEDIISQKVVIPTASTVYRKEVLKMDGFFLDVGIGDYPSLLYSLKRGYIYYFSRIMSVYRWCHKNSWSISMQDIRLNILHSIYFINFLQKYNEYTNKEYELVCINRIQFQIDHIMNLCKENKLEYFVNLCQRCDKELNGKYHKLFSQFIRLYLQIFDEKYLGENIKKFIKKNSKILIMGAGKYAHIIAKQLQYHQVEFEGFVISNNQKASKNYLNKPVWRFNECPYNMMKIGVIIGINPNEIISSLRKESIQNYICPFLVDIY